MTPKELSEFYTAMHEGKCVQYHDNEKWIDVDRRFQGPHLESNPKKWRIKPEPRRKWQAGHHQTYDAEVGSSWIKKGWDVIEWVEVIK
jgi:hypothetical protein